jgi:type VII secretion-associated serine protease mycosin
MLTCVRVRAYASAALAASLATASLVGPGVASAAADSACQTQVYPHVADPAAVPWAQTRLDFQRVWPITEGQNTTVAVIDSGVDRANPQLSDVQDGGDAYVPGTSGLSDPVGHGTMVAGIIAARPAAGVGFVGVAPRAHLISVKAAEGECESNTDAIANAILQAANLGAGVINISIASIVADTRLKQAVYDAEEAGIVIVAAAGNDATKGDAKVYPASYPGVLAVASVDPSGARSSFSSTGTAVSVAAPGSDIVSTGAGVDGLGVTGGSAAEGTSFAAPYVAGVAALVRSAYPHMSAGEIVRRIEATADHPAGIADPSLGWGVVDPYAAVTAVLPGEAAAHAAVQSPGKASAPKPLPDTGAGAAAHTADLVALGAIAAAAVIAGAAFGLPAARRRGWRPGRWGLPASDFPTSSPE